MEHTLIHTRGARIGKLISNSHSVEMILTGGDLFKMDGNHRFTTIASVEGRLWVTQQGDAQDYILEPGQSMLVTRSGAVLIQGQPNARLALIPPQPGLN